MEFNNKFEDGEKVKIKGIDEIVTVKEWSKVGYKRYSYTIVEQPGTFYFEYELKKA